MVDALAKDTLQSLVLVCHPLTMNSKFQRPRWSALAKWTLQSLVLVCHPFTMNSQFQRPRWSALAKWTLHSIVLDVNYWSPIPNFPLIMNSQFQRSLWTALAVSTINRLALIFYPRYQYIVDCLATSTLKIRALVCHPCIMNHLSWWSALAKGTFLGLVFVCQPPWATLILYSM